VRKVIEISIPDIGGNDGIEVIKWHKQSGEHFSQGDELCDLVTDKAAFALEAPSDGVLIEILAAEKSKVKIGDRAARIEIDE